MGNNNQPKKTVKHQHEQIVLCDECEGRGTVCNYDPHYAGYDEEPVHETCAECGGSGRIIRSGYTVIYTQPYK